jgi:hypothetical protein
VDRRGTAPNAFVFNIGEMLEIATQGYLEATQHRVVSPQAGVHRYSIPFFLGPRLDAVVKPLNWGSIGNALPVGERAVAARHLDTGVRAQSSDQLLGVAPGPQRDRQPGVGIHQQRAVDVRVQREVVHARHSRCHDRRQPHPHQVEQHARP